MISFLPCHPWSSTQFLKAHFTTQEGDEERDAFTTSVPIRDDAFSDLTDEDEEQDECEQPAQVVTREVEPGAVVDVDLWTLAAPACNRRWDQSSEQHHVNIWFKAAETGRAETRSSGTVRTMEWKTKMRKHFLQSQMSVTECDLAWKKHCQQPWLFPFYCNYKYLEFHYMQQGQVNRSMTAVTDSTWLSATLQRAVVCYSWKV